MKELDRVEEVVQGEFVDETPKLEEREGSRPLSALFEEAYDKGLTQRRPETSMIAFEDGFMAGFMGAPDAREILRERAKRNRLSPAKKTKEIEKKHD